MGKSTSEISEELEQTRSNAAEKIEQIEQQVTQSAETVKQSLDWRHQIESRPLAAVGGAFLSGLLLGAMTDGDNGGRSSSHPSNGSDSYSSSTSSGSQSGISASLKNAVRTSGAEEAFTSATAAVLTTAAQRVKEAIEETYPGFLERYETTKSTSGGVTDKIKAAVSEDSSTGAEQQMTA